MRKTAETQHNIHALLQERWSPRAFSSQTIAPAKLMSLFEAARWSPSGGNAQPWTFIVVTKDQTELHQKLVATMTGQNPNWAGLAPVLVLAVARPNPDRPAAAKFAYYDVGQAIAHLSVQAAALGLHVHQMGGFDAAKVRELFEIPEGYEPLTISAIGYFGRVEDLNDELRGRESLPRTRKPVSEFVYGGHWGAPLSLPSPDAAETQEAPVVTFAGAETQEAHAVTVG